MRLISARMLAAPAVLSILLLSGCGGSDPAAGPEDSTTASAADSKSGDKVMSPCEAISAEEVGAILGGTVTSEKDPNGGCQYDQSDPRSPSVGIFAIPGGPGTSNEAKAGNVTSGEVENLTGVGDEAWIAIGTTPGGSNQQGQGAVQVGNQAINVTLIQGKGLDAAKVRELTTALMKLAASKA